MTALKFVFAASISISFCVSAVHANDAELQRRIQATIKKVTPAYVFIGGGSGVVISADGYMLTNFHVARDVDSMRVRLPDGRQLVAKRVGIDPAGDITMLKMESDKPLPFVEFGDSDKLEIGQIAIAIGNPHGLGRASRQPSVSVGIVSAFNRSSNYDCAVQTDAAVNPGNSGGPLFDIDGKLIAINGQINTRFGNRVATGTGYSIPINRVKRFMPQFIAAKDMDKGRVRLGEISGLQLPSNADARGPAVVRGVEKDSAAEKDGFKTGDTIVAIDGYKVSNMTRLGCRLDTYPRSSKVALTVMREGKEVQLETTLAEVIRPFLGVSFDEAAANGKGAVINETIKGFPAEKAGLKKDDIVIEYNGVPIKQAEDLREQILKGKPNDPFTVKVLRDGKKKEFKGKLGER